jgi:glycosyltransferase involved in cell wall biosynthesis
VDRAIRIAIEAGMPLKIAAKVDPSDREYYESRIKPMFNHSNIEYIGEIREHQKAKFLGDAYAQIFPIDWPEPFGLCMIEAMACGTPTVAFDRGSVREILKEGTSGLIVDSVPQAVEALQKVSSYSRTACRSEFEARFSASRMANDYLMLYELLLSEEVSSIQTPKLDSSLAL